MAECHNPQWQIFGAMLHVTHCRTKVWSSVGEKPGQAVIRDDDHPCINGTTLQFFAQVENVYSQHVTASRHLYFNTKAAA